MRAGSPPAETDRFGTVRWLPFELHRNADQRAFWRILYPALADIVGRVSLRASANAAFRNLGAGNRPSLYQLVVGTDRPIWLSYDPDETPAHYASTHTSWWGEISVTRWLLSQNDQRRLEATILHELAHVNGAPGFPSGQAESVLAPCGFGDQDRHILGLRRRRRSRLMG